MGQGTDMQRIVKETLLNCRVGNNSPVEMFGFGRFMINPIWRNGYERKEAMVN